MALEVIGKVLKILPKQNGVGKNGAWSKCDFVIETMEQYPRKICISAWGDKSDNLEQQCPAGKLVKVSVNIESREFNDKWYTDVRAWRIEPYEEQAQEGFNSLSAIVEPEGFFETFSDEQIGKDVPF
ncbi:MAG: DUF3127 domain-containing protein [Lentimicrobiaceae bacterium]|nr:DUF3127 domain-containing protein [Lentimicrobiaceae bacterium]